MKTTTTLAIVAILPVGLTVASLASIHHVSAAPDDPKYANGEGSSHSNSNADNQGTYGAYTGHSHYTPHNQPCSVYC